MLNIANYCVWIFFCGSVLALPDPTPNVVIFLVDDLGIGDVGCFGNTTIKTPHIDSICEKGAKLSQHTAGEAMCTPSRAALLTGRLPIRSGMATHNKVAIIPFLGSQSGLPPNETTFAKVYQENGYKTALIGKWHLGISCETKSDFCHHPNNHGFDYFFGLPLSNFYDLKPGDGSITKHIYPNWQRDLIITMAIGIIIGFASWKQFGRIPGSLIIILTLGFVVPIYVLLTNAAKFNGFVMRNKDVVEQPVQLENMTKRLVNEGLMFLELREKDKFPFLLMMPWLQVHTALHAGPEFQGKSAHGPYGDEVEEMDWSVGEILKGLSKLGLDDNTLVYFTSDNGGQMQSVHQYHGYPTGGFNSIYPGNKMMGGQDGGMRVPSAIMWPGKIPPGSDIGVPTSHLDLFSTLLAIIDKAPPRDRVIDGENILPVLQGKKKTLEREFMFHYCGVWLHAVRYAPRNENAVYKVAYYWPRWDENKNGCHYPCTCIGHHIKLDKPKVFNVQDDPSENKPLDISSAKVQKILNRVEQEILVHNSTIDAVPSQFTLSQIIYRPWLQHCCNFPYCSCVDGRNALRYVPPWNR